MTTEAESLEYRARLEEYRALREEMMYALRSRVWGLASYVLFSGVILAFGADQDWPIGYFIPMVLALPYIWYTGYLERIRVRIHTYIEIMIEGEVTGLDWEKSLEIWRKKIHEKASRWSRFMDRHRYILSMIGVYDIVAISCLYLVFSENTSLWPGIGGLAVVSLILCGHVWINNILSNAEFYRNIWRSLRKDPG